ncbi:MAG: protein jag [Clostridia bacterium]|nr:protein jag [Clostridia bacterium]
MKKTVEITAKSLDEAVAEAVKELGAASADDITVSVLQEAKKGFLGLGSTPTVIRAEYDAPETADDKTAPVAEGGAQDVTADTAFEGASAGELIAFEFIKKLVADMNMDCTVTMREGDNDDVVISIEGEDAGSLIGHHGETLDSLQYLANLASNRKEEGVKREFSRITIDIEDYRAKREAALRVLARKKAAQVQKYKKSIMLEPMNPYERRIIHSEIQNVEGVSTNSIGTDNNRRIVIYLEESGMPSQPRKKAKKSVDPTAGMSNRSKKNIPSTFSDDDVKDPFDIDLSAALPQDDYNDED